MENLNSEQIEESIDSFDDNLQSKFGISISNFERKAPAVEIDTDSYSDAGFVETTTFMSQIKSDYNISSERRRAREPMKEATQDDFI